MGPSTGADESQLYVTIPKATLAMRVLLFLSQDGAVWTCRAFVQSVCFEV